ncbi:MAG: hypothetical protein IT373_18425 [Polyangiaceae bacterium]|nr:hypothetical protein [Polyangiaceae bacterium]
MKEISRFPAAPPAASPSDPRYYDARDLEAELRRTFQVCHECRMCVNYCGSFPELFARVDRDIDAHRAVGAEALHDADMRVVSEACWQCKLCYIKCPYTADEQAAELLDFPRLMAREKAARAARDGVSFVDRALGEPQLVGQLGSGFAAPIANLVLANRLVRKAQEVVTGISAEFPLPPMARQTFPTWMRRHEPAARAGEAGEVVLFATCYGNYNTPGVPQAAVRVLEHNGFRVHTVDETCCGMPNLDGGDVERFVAKVRHNVPLLLPHAKKGLPILVPAPTCAYTMKREWPEYVPEDDVRTVAGATLDLMEFLDRLARDKRLNRDFKTPLGRVAYHAACHLRAQKIGFPAAKLIGRLVPDTEVRVVEQCSAVDGTWGMKAAHYETGRRYAQKLVADVDAFEPDLVLTDCGLSALRLLHERKKPAMHPVEALARAYGLPS